MEKTEKGRKKEGGKMVEEGAEDERWTERGAEQNTVCI